MIKLFLEEPVKVLFALAIKVKSALDECFTHFYHFSNIIALYIVVDCILSAKLFAAAVY